MRNSIRAAFRAYLNAIGRHPVAPPLAGAVPPAFSAQQPGFGSDPAHRPRNEASAKQPRDNDFDAAGWPDVV